MIPALCAIVAQSGCRFEMSMTKKSGPAASRSAQSRAAKRRKSGVGKPKPSLKSSPKRNAASPRFQPPKAPKLASRLPVEAKGARAAIRKLRTELAHALKRVGELEASADTDFLLDIPNRRGFEREFQRAIAYIKRYDASGALIVLDVDRLKPINDAFGHAAGDQVLKAVAATLVREVRSSDVVGRLGGDEFAVLLWNLTETDARAKAASLEEAVDRLVFTFRGRNVTAGASAGVAVLGPQAEAGRAFEEADAAMYLRKAQRRHES
jgi:diguanylate cyclase (GGDEF)-like protein